MKLVNAEGRLSRSEMKNLKGGLTDSCAYYYAGPDGGVVRNISKSDALAGYNQAVADGYGAQSHWCCDSCGSASWY